MQLTHGEINRNIISQWKLQHFRTNDQINALLLITKPFIIHNPNKIQNDKQNTPVNPNTEFTLI